MTESRIFAFGTREDPVILSDPEDEPVSLQELTPIREANVMNQCLTLSETLRVLLVVQCYEPMPASPSDSDTRVIRLRECGTTTCDHDLDMLT